MLQSKIKPAYQSIWGNKRRMHIACCIFAALVVLSILYLYFGTYETTDDSYIEGRVVPISSRVPGYIKAIYVNDNELIASGQLLFEIDHKDYEFKVDRANAVLMSTIAQHNAALKDYGTAIVTVPSAFESAKAELASAKASYEMAKADLSRLQGLNNLTRTQKDLDHAIADEKTAFARLQDAEAKLKAASPIQQELAAARAKADGLGAQVMDAEAGLAQAKKDLMDTKIYAPYNGRVTNKQLEVGAYIQPGQTLFSVIGRDLWVIANFKENQIKKMLPGQAVDIRIDAFPNLKLTGKVDSIQAGTGSRLSLFPPENATGNFIKVVQRVPVKITFDKPLDPRIPIAVGMSVVPKVRTGW